MFISYHESMVTKYSPQLHVMDEEQSQNSVITLGDILKNAISMFAIQSETPFGINKKQWTIKSTFSLLKL